jgi:hypothetical protein
VRSLEWQTFFRGIKKHFGACLRWTIANLCVSFLLGFYAWFFITQTDPAGRSSTLIGIVLALALLWWILNMYTFPFMLVQTQPSYLNALRNSAFYLSNIWTGVGIYALNLIVILSVFGCVSLAGVEQSRFDGLLIGERHPGSGQRNGSGEILEFCGRM